MEWISVLGQVQGTRYFVRGMLCDSKRGLRYYASLNPTLTHYWL